MARVDGLDEIVGDFRPDSLVHDVFLFALGTHHNGSSGLDVLDLLQGLQSAQSRHHFIEEDEVEGLLPAQLDGIRAIAHRGNLVTFLLQEDDMRLEELNFIIDP